MKAFTRLDAIAAPLPIANVDTDKILAARFLKTIRREGLGSALFSTLREDEAFVLNRTPWRNAGILIALDNFGCGSSREHAPWALLDFGIRCIIAPSIADIFYNNCFKNGILPIVLPKADVDRLMALASDPAACRMEVDLEKQAISDHTGMVMTFEIDPKRKQDLLEGADEIARSLELAPAIAAFEGKRRHELPWFPGISAMPQSAG